MEHICFCARIRVTALLAEHLKAAGFRQELSEPAQGSRPERDNEWLGLWRR